MLEHLRGAEELHALPPPPSSFCAAITLCLRAPRRRSSSIPTTSPELLSSTPATPTMPGLPARPPLVWIEQQFFPSGALVSAVDREPRVTGAAPSSVPWRPTPDLDLRWSPWPLEPEASSSPRSTPRLRLEWTSPLGSTACGRPRPQAGWIPRRPGPAPPLPDPGVSLNLPLSFCFRDEQIASAARADRFQIDHTRLGRPPSSPAGPKPMVRPPRRSPSVFFCCWVNRFGPRCLFFPAENFS
ncbi:hypothetical protein VPH35_066118 [Triticum aestivum]